MLVLVTLAACGTQSVDETVVEDVNIQLTVEPDPPAVGDSELIITVTREDGTPISDAAIAVHGDMDHEGMEPVDSNTSDGENGVYRVPFQWPMGGSWILNVTVTLPDNGGVAKAQFETFVGAVSQDSVVNQSGSDAVQTDLEPVQIRYEPNADPPVVGDAEATVIVRGANGMPVEDAQVSVRATMQGHGMRPVEGASDNSVNGRYTVPIHWTAAGDWLVEVTVIQADGTATSETFEQTVAERD